MQIITAQKYKCVNIFNVEALAHVPDLAQHIFPFVCYFMHDKSNLWICHYKFQMPMSMSWIGSHNSNCIRFADTDMEPRSILYPMKKISFSLVKSI